MTTTFRESDIDIGHRFRKRGSPSLEWEVVGFHEAPGEPRLHVKLQRVDQSVARKTVAAGALLEPSWFERGSDGSGET